MTHPTRCPGSWQGPRLCWGSSCCSPCTACWRARSSCPSSSSGSAGCNTWCCPAAGPWWGWIICRNCEEKLKNVAIDVDYLSIKWCPSVYSWVRVGSIAFKIHFNWEIWILLCPCFRQSINPVPLWCGRVGMFRSSLFGCPGVIMSMILIMIMTMILIITFGLSITRLACRILTKNSSSSSPQPQYLLLIPSTWEQGEDFSVWIYNYG